MSLQERLNTTSQTLETQGFQSMRDAPLTEPEAEIIEAEIIEGEAIDEHQLVAISPDTIADYHSNDAGIRERTQDTLKLLEDIGDRLGKKIKDTTDEARQYEATADQLRDERIGVYKAQAQQQIQDIERQLERKIRDEGIQYLEAQNHARNLRNEVAYARDIIQFAVDKVNRELGWLQTFHEGITERRDTYIAEYNASIAGRDKLIKAIDESDENLRNLAQNRSDKAQERPALFDNHAAKLKAELDARWAACDEEVKRLETEYNSYNEQSITITQETLHTLPQGIEDAVIALLEGTSSLDAVMTAARAVKLADIALDEHTKAVESFDGLIKTEEIIKDNNEKELATVNATIDNLDRVLRGSLKLAAQKGYNQSFDMQDVAQVILGGLKGDISEIVTNDPPADAVPVLNSLLRLRAIHGGFEALESSTEDVLEIKSTLPSLFGALNYEEIMRTTLLDLALESHDPEVEIAQRTVRPRWRIGGAAISFIDKQNRLNG